MVVARHGDLRVATAADGHGQDRQEGFEGAVQGGVEMRAVQLVKFGELCEALQYTESAGS